MTSQRNTRIAAAFAARARVYENHAALQAHTARTLSQYLPDLEQPKVLEIGCGTGLLTRHLLERYGQGDFLITDLATDMLARCRARVEVSDTQSCRFAVMDGEEPESGQSFDVIALSMTLQWFADPVAGLARLKTLLKPGGTLLFATLGPDCFAQWRGALDAYGLPHGVIAMPCLPGIVEQESRSVQYEDGTAFLNALKAIGAHTPRSEYQALPPGMLRKALRRLEQAHDARVTWHTVYGRICV